MYYPPKLPSKLRTWTSNIIEKLTKPHSKYYPDQLEYETATTRNKAVLFSQFLLFLSYTIDSLINVVPTQQNLMRYSSSLVACGVLYLSCRYHPQILKIFVTGICLAYGPILLSSSKTNIHNPWFSAVVLPISSYMFTGSLWHFLFQLLVQNIYTNTYYAKLMQEVVTYMDPIDFTQAFVYTSNRFQAFIVVFVLVTHYFMQEAYHRVMVVEKAKDEFERQKTFLLSFSHELRNLINSLTGNIKLARLENLNQRAKELMRSAEVCGEVLLHLVNNILDTGKVEIGELEINSTPTRIYETLERIWRVCSELIKIKQLHGKITMEKDLPQNIIIDHYRLTQILLNLVGNAIKFTERGSVEISVSWINNRTRINDECFKPYPFNETAEDDEGLFEKQKCFSLFDDNILTLDIFNKRVESSVLKRSCMTNEGILKIIVSDTGCGMTEEEKTKLFQKFSQVTSDLSKRKLGTGLGLFITKQLCQKMNGDIRVFSKKDKGSAFILCIPVKVVEEKDNEPVWNLDLLKNFLISKKLKAMIVDDIPFSHTVLKSFFDKLGIEVVDVAINGLEAYQKYNQQISRNNRPQIITMDLDMPVVDGKEATKKIRGIELEKGLQPCFISIISGNCSKSEITECLDKNGPIKADGFIKKPASLEELIQVIGQYFVALR